MSPISRLFVKRSSLAVSPSVNSAAERVTRILFLLLFISASKDQCLTIAPKEQGMLTKTGYLKKRHQVDPLS